MSKSPVICIERKEKLMMSSSQSHLCSCSGEIIGHNEDLLTKISVNLPVKSILRFKSVSKQWKTLLTRPQFAQLYSSSTRKRNSMLFFQRNSYTHSFDSLYQLKGSNVYHNDLDLADFGYLQIPTEYSLYSVKPCNGLLLFEFLDNPYNHEKKRKVSFYVCNPSTRKYRELVLPDYIATPKGESSSHLAFDPCSSPYYKVLFFWMDGKSSHYYHISIYSSETKACQKLNYTYEFQYVPYLVAFFNGSFFGSDYDLDPIWYYFDINQEFTKKVLPHPPYSDPTKDNIEDYFGGDGGHLHLILGDETDLHDVYELNKDYSSWVAKFKVDFYAIGEEYFKGSNTNSEEEEQHYKYRILCVLENEKEASVFVHVENRLGNQLMAYNCSDKTAKKLYDIPWRLGEKEGWRWYKVFQCTESLSDV